MNKNREVLSPETRVLQRSLDEEAELEPKLGAILRHFETIPPALIAAVSLQIRHDADLYTAAVGSFWLSPPKPHAALKLLQRTPGLKFIYIFHSSGYVREASLNKITGGLESPFFVAAIMWRMNDWVAPVRAAASRCAQRVFPLTQPEIIARAGLDLLKQQYGWERWGELERSMVDNLYARPDVTSELARLLIQQATRPTPSTFRHALRTPLFDAHLEDISSKSVHPMVRATAVETLIDRAANWRSGFRLEWVDKRYNLKRWIPTYSQRELVCLASPGEIANRAILDRSPFVRRVVLDCVSRNSLPADVGLQYARQVEFDRSGAVREAAAFILRR